MSDLIDRQEVLKEMKKMYDDADWWSKASPDNRIKAEAYKTSLTEMALRVDKIHVANRWKPCSERLPEEYKEVWVTIKGFDVIQVKEGETLKEAAERVSKIRWVTRGSWSDEEKCWIDNQFGFPLVCQPIAWMEINEPEPWEGEE